MLHLNKIEREDHLFAAFSYFDKDGSGFITPDELQNACKEFGIEDVRLEDMIQEVDQDNVSDFQFISLAFPYCDKYYLSEKIHKGLYLLLGYVHCV